jgi:hypothetical protein
MSLLSGTFVAALLCLWFVAVAYTWGVWLLRLARAEPDDCIESIATAVPLGFVVPAMVGFLLGVIHLFTAASLALVLLGLTALQFRTVLGFRKLSLPAGKLPFDAAFPLVLTFPVLLLNFTWAISPEIQFDANNYHLAVPKIYLGNGGFLNLPYFFHSYYAHLAEMLYAFPMAVQGQAAAKLLSFVLSVVAGCCVFSIGKTAFDTRVGCWAAAFFYTTPIVGWLAGTAYTDNLIAMFLAATVLTFVKWYKNPASTGWLYVGSLLAGLAVAAKINAAFGLVAFIAMVCWNTRRIGIRRVGLMVVMTAAVVVPWYALTYHWTGNPVMPMLNGFFKSPLSEPVNRLVNSNDFGIGTSPGSLIRLPFRLVFNTERFAEAAPRGSAGLALLIALPFSVILFSQARVAGLLIAAAAIYWMMWSYTFQYVRYFVPILPVVCVLAVATVLRLDSGGIAARARRLCLVLGLIMQFPSMPVQFSTNIAERFPIRMALGLETREHFLSRSLVGYSAAQHLNKITSPADRVVGAGVEQIRLYLNAPLETLSDSTLESRLRDVVPMPPDQTLLRSLRDAGFGYILATRAALQNPPDWYPYLKNEFLDRYARLEFSDLNVVVYRLNP